MKRGGEREQKSWSLAELAEETGLTGRTVRYYISRGLLPGPSRTGRGARYGRDHLERLLEIQRLQAEGRTLAEIARSGSGAEPALPEPRSAWVYDLAEGVEVRLDARMAPWRARHIRRLLADLAGRLNDPDEISEGDEE